MDIHLIDSGFFNADGGAMFGAIPKVSWNRRYPCNERNECVLAMRSALITTDDGHVILIDTGAGTKHLKQLSYYKFFDLHDISEELNKYGVTPEQITDVVFTHLHFDHCGYTTIEEQGTDGNVHYSLMFPNAKHWVSHSQWQSFTQPNAFECSSYFLEDMQAVADKHQLCLINKDTWLCSQVQLRLFNGHTLGQIAAYIKKETDTYVYCGDVIPMEASISPAWISAYDIEPVVSYNEKVRMLDEAATQNQILIFSHDAYHSMSRVRKINDFYVKQPI
jgi:glyoxylase-like metal-dependent hydrolase (beta-lactamase superfamily II)